MSGKESQAEMGPKNRPSFEDQAVLLSVLFFQVKQSRLRKNQGMCQEWPVDENGHRLQVDPKWFLDNVLYANRDIDGQLVEFASDSITSHPNKRDIFTISDFEICLLIKRLESVFNSENDELHLASCENDSLFEGNPETFALDMTAICLPFALNVYSPFSSLDPKISLKFEKTAEMLKALEDPGQYVFDAMQRLFPAGQLTDVRLLEPPQSGNTRTNLL